MAANKALVLDANILICAVLGTRVRRIFETYAGRTSFFVPESAYLEAEEHLAELITKRGGNPKLGLASLRAMASLTELVTTDMYTEHAAEAKKRIGSRDPEDWPVLASAITFGCPIWTEDTDFFGCGVATWTSSRVEIFLSDYISPPLSAPLAVSQSSPDSFPPAPRNP